jgi:signal transduction histidine kinase
MNASDMHTAARLAGVVAPVTAVLVAMFVFTSIGHEVIHVNEPAHAAVETFGASVALMLWLLLMLRHTTPQWESESLWTAFAFLAMGIFDGFHATTHFAETPNRFVLSHSLAVFAGGVLFALVCLPRRSLSQRSAWWLSIAFIVIVVGIGIYAIAFPVAESLMPQMVQADVFTPAAKMFNVGGGIGFVIAGVYFAWRSFDPEGWEARVLAALCFLLGAGGILLDFSDPWDAVWWGWHGARAFAFMIALGYFALVYRRQSMALAGARLDLERRAAELDASNKELEDFAYSVAHDLRTPLRAMDGFARMVMEEYATKLDDEGKRQLGVIRASAKKMGQLIDDLLAFSRMGRREMTPADIDMTALAGDAAGQLHREEQDRIIEIVIAPLPPVRGDFTMIQLVWANLLSNAAKFTRPRAQARIEVSGRSEERENIYCVKDNGVGFDMQYVGKLFGVFQRLHGPVEFEGTGVGLALAQRIVHRHGGRIWAEGKLDEGATFCFALPNTAFNSGEGT